MKCTNCGTEHSANFCPNCGAPAQINSAQQSTQWTQQTPPQQPWPTQPQYNPQGAPPTNKKMPKALKIVLIIIAIIFGIGILGNIFGDAAGADSSATQSSAPAPAVVQPPPLEESIPSIQPEAQPPALSEDEFKSLAVPIEDYKDLIRNPEIYIEQIVVIEVEVQQTMSGGLFDDYTYYRCNANDEYDLWLGDEYYIKDARETDTTKILDTDIIRIYGVYEGTTEITRALTGTTEEIPQIVAKYIEIIK
ncbi:MAG: zinc ribbon domain-containing protein [Oscillospiraceae bacterium]